MLRQYFEMKSRVPDAILFYRMGDFYEMFFEDAREAAPLLGIALTARHRDSDIEAPMCGVPWHSADHHIAKLIAAGRKVAVCDQLEDARGAKLVRRDITRIVTPGTVLDPESLLPGAAVVPRGGSARGEDAEVAFLDVSTGSLQAGSVPRGARGRTSSPSFGRAKCCCPEGARRSRRRPVVETRRAGGVVRGRPPRAAAAAARRTSRERRAAAAAALAYARGAARPNALAHVRPAIPLRFGERMSLDASALATLEVFESSDGETSRSLFASSTGRGRRSERGRSRDALARPSTDPMELEARWDAVEELVGDAAPRAERSSAALDGVGDLERRFARIAVGTARSARRRGVGRGARAPPRPSPPRARRCARPACAT